MPHKKIIILTPDAFYDALSASDSISAGTPLEGGGAHDTPQTRYSRLGRGIPPPHSPLLNVTPRLVL